MIAGILSFIAIMAIIAVGIIFYRAQGTEHSGDKRKQYLDALNAFVEGQMAPLADFENSFAISFRYEGVPFVYEDIEEKIIKACQYSGNLKCPTKTKVGLSFSEKPRGSIKVSLDSFHDVAAGWVKHDNKLLLPKPLKEFDVYTSDRPTAEKLLADEYLVEMLARFKCVDGRERPVLSLHLLNGEVVLRFHPPGGLQPTRLDLMQNVSSIDPHLDQLKMIAKKIDQLCEEKRHG